MTSARLTAADTRPDQTVIASSVRVDTSGRAPASGSASRSSSALAGAFARYQVPRLWPRDVEPAGIRTGAGAGGEPPRLGVLGGGRAVQVDVVTVGRRDGREVGGWWPEPPHLASHAAARRRNDRTARSSGSSNP